MGEKLLLGVSTPFRMKTVENKVTCSPETPCAPHSLPAHQNLGLGVGKETQSIGPIPADAPQVGES